MVPATCVQMRRNRLLATMLKAIMLHMIQMGSGDKRQFAELGVWESVRSQRMSREPQTKELLTAESCGETGVVA